MTTEWQTWPGYADPRAEAVLLGAVAAGERVLAGPVPFDIGKLDRNVARGGQSWAEIVYTDHTNLVVTDRALYFCWLAHTDGHPSRLHAYERYGLERLGPIAVEFGQSRPVGCFSTATYPMAQVRMTLEGLGTRHLRTVWSQGYWLIEALKKAVSDAQGASGVGRSRSVAEELDELAGLVRSGVLNDSDWERAKDLFLGKAPDARMQALQLLAELDSLRRSGVLSDSEFNAKKWEILSSS